MGCPCCCVGCCVGACRLGTSYPFPADRPGPARLGRWHRTSWSSFGSGVAEETGPGADTCKHAWSLLGRLVGCRLGPWLVGRWLVGSRGVCLRCRLRGFGSVPPALPVPLLVRSRWFEVPLFGIGWTDTHRLAGWLVGWLAGWLVGWMDGWLDGWLADWLVGWLVCCC